MNSLTNNRVFIGILLVLLQLALLPNARRCSEATLIGGQCCCTFSANEASAAFSSDSTSESKHDCCSRNASQKKSGESDPEPVASSHSAKGDGSKTCTCSHANAHTISATQTDKRGDLLKKHIGAWLPTAAGWNQSCHAVVARDRCKKVPRAQTGPPLRLLYQVFLI